MVGTNPPDRRAQNLLLQYVLRTIAQSNWERKRRFTPRRASAAAPPVPSRQTWVPGSQAGSPRDNAGSPTWMAKPPRPRLTAECMRRILRQEIRSVNRQVQYSSDL